MKNQNGFHVHTARDTMVQPDVQVRTHIFHVKSVTEQERSLPVPKNGKISRSRYRHWLNPDMAQFKVTVDRSIKDKFVEICKFNNESISEVIEDLMILIIRTEMEENEKLNKDS